MGQSEPVTLSQEHLLLSLFVFYGSNGTHLDAGDDIKSFLKG
jgi:hypothetical protein